MVEGKPKVKVNRNASAKSRKSTSQWHFKEEGGGGIAIDKTDMIQMRLHTGMKEGKTIREDEGKSKIFLSIEKTLPPYHLMDKASNQNCIFVI